MAIQVVDDVRQRMTYGLRTMASGAGVGLPPQKIRFSGEKVGDAPLPNTTLGLTPSASVSILAQNTPRRMCPSNAMITEPRSLASCRADFPALQRQHNGLPMAFRHRTFDLTGLQFHPESVMTEFGDVMIGNWLSE